MGHPVRIQKVGFPFSTARRSKWCLWRSSIAQSVHKMGKATADIHHCVGAHEVGGCPHFRHLPLPIRLWPMGTRMDNEQLQITSCVCNVDVSTSFTQLTWS